VAEAGVDSEMALPSGTPTHQHSVTKRWTRLDKVVIRHNNLLRHPTTATRHPYEPLTHPTNSQHRRPRPPVTPPRMTHDFSEPFFARPKHLAPKPCCARTLVMQYPVETCISPSRVPSLSFGSLHFRPGVLDAKPSQ
jgi:hypothetical protein